MAASSELPAADEVLSIELARVTAIPAGSAGRGIVTVVRRDLRSLSRPDPGTQQPEGDARLAPSPFPEEGGVLPDREGSMPNMREFTVDNFRFANNDLTPVQDLLITSFANLIFTGDATMPPLSRVDEVVVVGHAKGTSPEKHAVLRGFVVKERLIDHLEAFGPSTSDLGKVRLGDPVATTVPSNSGVTGEDRKAVVHVSWTKPKKKEKPSSVQPLSRREVKLFVWSVIGKRPKRVSSGQLAKEFMEFTDLQSLLKNPSIASAAKAFFTTYAKLVSSVFSGEPERKWGVLVGGTYSILDEATDAKKTRKVLEGDSRKKKLFAKGFSQGYGEMRAHLAGMGDDRTLRRLLNRLSLVAPRTTAMRHIYSALTEVTMPELRGSQDIMYMSAREDCRFAYPGFAVSHAL